MKSAVFRTLAAAILLPWATVAAAADGERWEDEVRPLFDLYADGLNGRRYADFLAACDMSSRSLFRELTLYEMDLMPIDELRSVLPWDDDDKPIALADLVRMTNDEFWKVYLRWMHRHQEATGRLFADLSDDQLGRPKYVLKAMVRQDDTVYMIADRQYKTESPVPIPLMVAEAVREGGKWKLKLPREILWDSMEHARQRKIAAEAAAAEKNPKEGEPHDHEHADDHDHE